MDSLTSLQNALRLPLAAALLGLAMLAAPATADVIIDVDVFHDRLSPYGSWIAHDRYGEVWRPSRARGWRPYSNGRWVYTDDYGWLWVERDEWGWATEHYGRWFFDDARGWLWIPGTEWAPAWVVWRSTPDYIGWAPLAPRGYRYDDDYDDRRWHFVEGGRFLTPNVRTVIIDRSRNRYFLQRVPLRGEVRHSRGRWENRALDTVVVERATRKPVPRVRVRELERAQRAAVERDTVAVYRPQVRERSQKQEQSRATNERERAKAQEQQRRAQPQTDTPRAKTEERRKAEPRRVEQAEPKRREPSRATKPPAAEQNEKAPQRKQEERAEPRRAPQAKAKAPPQEARERARNDRSEPQSRASGKRKPQQEEKQERKQEPEERGGEGKGRGRN